MLPRLAVLSVVAAALLAQNPRYDLLLKGGHVIDPKNRIDAVMDVAVAGGEIARVARGIPASDARQVVDVSGLYVTPGLIDIHTHLYSRQWTTEPPHRTQSADPDAFSFRCGVTTMVDAGTSGWRDFPEFRSHTIDRAKTRVLAFLNIVGSGMGTGKEDDPAEMDPEAAARAARANSGIIVGFKSAHYAGPGWFSVDNAVKAGKLANLPVMIDFGQITKERNIRALLLEKLRPGDIYTHCYSGLREELLPDGKVNPVMWEGRKRGIIFDLGHGGGSFFWNIAVPAYEQKFYPDSISSDLHGGSMNAGMKNFTNIMSKLLNLGSPLQALVAMASWNPAREIRHPELGNLDAGAEADVAVLRVERGNFGFVDSAGARYPGTQKIICELTLRKGKVAWDLNGLASRDWRSFPYRKRHRGQPRSAH